MFFKPLNESKCSFKQKQLVIVVCGFVDIRGLTALSHGAEMKQLPWAAKCIGSYTAF